MESRENEILLSILIPSIPERMDGLKALIDRYQRFIDTNGLSESVEIISFIDNKKRSIGRKRQDLISLAKGKYFVISDDDDSLYTVYFAVIKDAIDKDADVITYLQSASINCDHSIVQFGHKNENEELKTNGITKRKAWYCCTWKREIVKDIEWENINWGEDSSWADRANELAQSSYHLNEICHEYRHDSTKTAAFQ